jgi:hypothetical protein
MRFLSDIIDFLKWLFIPRAELNRQVAKAIDLQDLFSDDAQLSAEEVGSLDGGFKMFSSKDDYNREFLTVFQSCKSSFFLDYNHKDGHFRV